MTQIPSPKRPLLIWDLAVSMSVLAVGVIFVAVAAVIDLISAIFVSNCPQRTCSAGAAVAALGVSWFAIFLLLIVGAVLTILALVRRRLAWWIALVALVVIVAVWITGIVVYSQAMNHDRSAIVGLVALAGSLRA